MLLQFIKRAFMRRRPPAALNALALEHYGRGEYLEAERYFREVIPQSPGDVSAWSNLAAALLKQHKFEAALPILRQVVELNPEFAEAHSDLGRCYARLLDNHEAIRHYERAIGLKPDLHEAYANLVDASLACCDWDAVDRLLAEFMRYLKEHPAHLSTRRLHPFTALSLLPKETARALAIAHAQNIARAINRAPGDREPARHIPATGKIRIGYVSADFCAHATADLTFGLYALHERRRFEILVYSTGPDDSSVQRRHIAQTCDRFVDVRQESAERTARRIQADGVDILVDMKGYTAESRPEIFAHRPAPLQVSYLGYPGTSGAEYIDYFISDAVATPPGYEAEFTENVVYLPDCYQVNDNRQPISERVFSRSDFGLPDGGFVYCSFNRLAKIDRTVFSLWMAILHRVPGSVLWLIEDEPQARINLRKAAQARNVDPERLVFSGRLAKPDHLARHRLADLFLDTTMCNAHTGASDALWAGLPILTCPGEAFATRVAASLLHTAGLPELIAHDLVEYENVAARLASEPEALSVLKAKLARNRTRCPLFDTPRYVRNLEAAYERMHTLRMRGERPRSFAVERGAALA